MRWLPMMLAILFSTAALHSQQVPTLDRTKLVHDLAGVLGASGPALNAQLEHYEDTSSNEFVVVILPSMTPYMGGTPSIEEMALALCEAYGFGKQGKDNGLLLLVSMEERRMRIEVGYGLEAVITDGLAKRVIEQYLKPKFKDGDYAGGITSGLAVLMKLASGEFTADDVKGGGMTDWLPLIALLFFIVVIIIRGLKNRGNGGTSYDGRGVHRSTPWIFLGGMGGGLGGGGGGGFGGFGGGGFGGGGASGGW